MVGARDDGRQYAGQQFHCQQIVICKGVPLAALNVYEAQHPIAILQGNAHLRARCRPVVGAAPLARTVYVYEHALAAAKHIAGDPLAKSKITLPEHALNRIAAGSPKSYDGTVRVITREHDGCKLIRKILCKQVGCDLRDFFLVGKADHLLNHFMDQPQDSAPVPSASSRRRPYSTSPARWLAITTIRCSSY